MSEPSALRAVGGAPDAAVLRRNNQISLAVKLGFTLFTLFHAWVDVRFYGPGVYLWFCDLTVLICTLALWTENRLLLSMCALASLGPSIIWSADLFWRIAFHHWLIGMAAYMTAKLVPIPIRLAATFHLWMPILLVLCLRKMGYERRALFYQTIFAISLLIFCRIISRPPPANGPTDNVNINFVYGHTDKAPVTHLPAWLYLTQIILMYWFLMYLPIHLTLCSLIRDKPWLGRSKLANFRSVPAQS